MNFKEYLEKTICIFTVAVMLFCGGIEGFVFSFYSEGMYQTVSLSTGSVDVGVENLYITDNEIIWSNDDDTQDAGTLRINKADIISFDITNNGKSAADYLLELQIAWNTNLSEAGKLFLFPANIDDSQIYENIQNGIFDNAIISINILDNNSIITANGIQSGISKIIDKGILNVANENVNSSSAKKNYEFKLFLYEHSDISEQPALYHGEEITINIIVHSNILSKPDTWQSTEKHSFIVTTIIDNNYPVIHEIPQNKVFFSSLAEGINFADYAYAVDTFDGDITNKIEITSSPLFTPDKAGTYTITYNVTNSLGSKAVPLHIKITIWNFSKITSGYYHTLALTSHGKVYVWGYNQYGQLGDGTNTDRQKPTLLQGLDNIIDIAAGIGCSYALTEDGQTYSWGRNENGRLGDNTVIGKNYPVKVAQPEGIKFVQISSRFATAGGLTANGDIYTWGYGGYGAAGNGGTSDKYIPTKINVSDIKYIEMGYYNGAAISLDGRLYTWGNNTNGQLGVGTSGNIYNPELVPYFDGQTNKLKQVSVGRYHMTAITEDGNLYTWGDGAEGKLGNGTTVDKNIPQPITMSTSVIKALAGYSHTGIVTSDGKAYFFGQNLYGKHGNGSTANNSTPVMLNGIDGVVDISLGMDTSFVLKNNMIVYGMGYGGTGVLGTGNNSNSTTPVVWAFTPPPPSLNRLLK